MPSSSQHDTLGWQYSDMLYCSIPIIDSGNPSVISLVYLFVDLILDFCVKVTEECSQGCNVGTHTELSSHIGSQSLPLLGHDLPPDHLLGHHLHVHLVGHQVTGDGVHDTHSPSDHYTDLHISICEPEYLV